MADNHNHKTSSYSWPGKTVKATSATLKANMAQVKVYYDQVGNTLTVWFDDPENEFEAGETGEEIILMKNKQGAVIGVEKLNFTAVQPESLRVAFETVTF